MNNPGGDSPAPGAYVLGHSDRVWSVPEKTVRPTGSVVIAKSDHGPINVRLDR